jgi:hypothetical protein
MAPACPSPGPPPAAGFGGGGNGASRHSPLRKKPGWGRRASPYHKFVEFPPAAYNFLQLPRNMVFYLCNYHKKNRYVVRVYLRENRSQSSPSRLDFYDAVRKKNFRNRGQIPKLKSATDEHPGSLVSTLAV